MQKRGRTSLGLVSLIVAVTGAAGLGACASDDGVSGAGGTAGKSSAGSAGNSNGGTAGAGDSAGEGGTVAGSAGNNTAAGAPNQAGSAGCNEPTSGAAGADDGGSGGEAGAVLPLPSNLVRALSPLPALPTDTTNQFADNAAAATFGQRLFFDKRYAGPLVSAGPLGAVGDLGKVACVTCHAGPALSDGREPFNVTLGTDFHTRNAPALVNSSFYTWTNWAGRFAAQWELPPAVAENPLTMNSNRLKIAHFIYDHYKADYEAIFGALDPALASTAADAARFPASGKPKASGGVDGPWEGMTTDDQKVVVRIIANFGKALQAFVRKLVSREAPFDAYVANQGTISESAQRGAELFVTKAKCSACHSGPFLSDNSFHNLGVPQAGDHVPATDDGRFKDAATLLASGINVKSAYSDDVTAGAALLSTLTSPMPDSSKGAFRTASLREVAVTGPYMHSGQLPTLAAVVSFYNAGGGDAAAGSTKDALLTPLGLTSSEQLDLIEFLKTLSGAAVPAALLIDTSGQ